MMSDDERLYFRERAEAEIRAAQTAGHPEAARAHYVLAGYYLDLSHNHAGPPLAPAIDDKRCPAGNQAEPILQ